MMEVSYPDHFLSNKFHFFIDHHPNILAYLYNINTARALKWWAGQMEFDSR
jgi:hypothetical protein